MRKNQLDGVMLILKIILVESRMKKIQKVKLCPFFALFLHLQTRKKGIARNLLKFVCSLSQNNSYDIIEAYPRKGKEISDAHSYRGPISLHLFEGFTIYKEFDDYYVVRKEF